MDEREIFVRNVIKDRRALILEIGPLNRPIVKKAEFPNCFYSDIRSTEQVKMLYSGNDYLETTGIHVDVDTIVDIDYVLDESYDKTFAGMEKFDYVVASHVMEHMEDIIGFFQDIASVLKPGGKLCIIYPDKRYCFDHFRESASFRDAYDVYRRGQQETARMVLDFYNTAINENNPTVFWQAKDMHLVMPHNDTDKSIAAYERTIAGEKQGDVHFWPFTDAGFIKFLYDCTRAKLLPFSCVEFHPAQENSQQFLVALQFNPGILDNNYLELENLKQLISTLPLDYYNSQQIQLQRSNIQLNQQTLELTVQNNNLEKENKELTEQIVQLREENVELQNKNNVLITQNTTMADSIKVLSIQNSKLINEVGSLSAQHGTLIKIVEGEKAQNKELSAQNVKLIDEMESLSIQNSKLINEVGSLSAQHGNLIKIIDDEKAQNTELFVRVKDLETIKNSTLWKTTKPLRVMLDAVKRLFIR